MPDKSPLEQDPIQFFTRDLPPTLVQAVGEVAQNLGELTGPRQGVEDISVSTVREMVTETINRGEGFAVSPVEVTKAALAARLTAMNLNENKQ